MNRLIVLGMVAELIAGTAWGQNERTASAPESVKAEKETRYLAFQIFTYYSPDPKVASLLSSGSREKLVPGTTALRNYVDDIKGRIGVVGDKKTRLAVMLGPLCFEQTNAEVTEFVSRAFDLALESDVAVGFHIDDSIFWLRRKDLWSDPKNVEALDWEGTPCTGRRLDWSKQPSVAPPQMCFNSEVIEREVHERATLLGKAIQAGVKRLQERNRPELFAGVIAGWETMIGQDFKTGKYLGYRALLNRGFGREHPPKDMDLEREKVVKEFIDLWTEGLALAGVSPDKTYSHTAFLSRRAFNLGDDKAITYMKRDKDSAYSQHNHFAPPSVAFGTHHRPGFSTYPQPGLFDDIYEELAKHKHVGWASCEETNMQPSSGPGQTGMGMETYLAKMFNHGATLVNIFAWGIGGDAMKNRSFRVVTEGEDALQAYRKFLKGEALVEARTTARMMERLPPQFHHIQKELPAWIQQADAGNKEKARATMQKLDEQMKAKNFEEVEKTADSILKLMGANAEPQAAPGDAVLMRSSEKVERAKETAQNSVWYTVGNLSVPLLARAWGSPVSELMRKSGRLRELMPKAQMAGPEQAELQSLSAQLSKQMDGQRFAEAGRTLDRMLVLVGHRGALPEGDPRADMAEECATMIGRARGAGADGVEDYIGWAVVETKPDQWDWSLYQENARAIRKAGLKYIPYVWVQNLPSWVRHGADFRFATCLEHGKACEALSVFSPKTVEAYDRVFAELKSALGPQIDALRIGSPYDYGETHYPAGDSNRAFPDAHMHQGWWAGEPEAKQHFRRWVEKEYGDSDRLNAAWGTQFSGFAFDYPRDPTSPRAWLDFVEWYHEAFIERLGVLFDVARRHFPETPICVNLGWPLEKIVLGQDLTGLVKMLAAKGITVRTPTGPMVTHLYSRRVATAARFYHPPKLSTEPADGAAPLKEIAGALFKDLTTGTTWHFDYLDNMDRARALFQHARALPRHAYPRIDAAVVFSTAAHRLENWEWHEGFRGGYPEGMAPWLEGLRDVLDYDVVDERLIDDGALRNYRLLIWPFGIRIEARTIEKIRDWVEHGGTLLVRDLAAVRTVEGKLIVAPTGKGRVVDAGGSLDRLTEVVRTRDARMTGLPPLDARPDGVITSLFDDGLLVFNRTAKEVTLELPTPAGRWDLDYPGLPASVTLSALEIRWLDRQGRRKP